MSLTLFLALFGGLLVAEVIRSHFQLRREMGATKQRGRLQRYPSVSVIRPIRGLDHGARENIRAALNHGYPGHAETLFVFDDASEPALPIVNEEIKRASAAAGKPISARVLFSGQPPAHRTGKLHAMIKGLEEARGELIAFADSDIRPGKRALTSLVETLVNTPDAGSAFAPVVVTEEPATVGDVGYALLLNGMYGPTAAAIANRNGGRLPFIMGQFMVLRREAIDAIGGLESAQGQLVDDMYLGMRINAAGYSNAVSHRAVPIIQRDLSLKPFLQTYLRWITFSRSGLPALSFKLASWLRGIVFWSGILLAVGALFFGAWLASALGLLASVALSSSINRLHVLLGGAPLRWRHSPVAFALLLVAPLVMAKVLVRHEVQWRGRTYRLNRQSRLASGGALPANQI